MGGKISPSMMCADITDLKRYLTEFEQLGIEYLHVDVMDGVFVPNLQLGTDYIRQLRKASNIPLDIHLMITQPENKIEWLDLQEGEYVSVHYESTVHVQRALQRIKDKGAKPMLALNPATPLQVLEDCLPDLDAVLIMTVNPGFGGQSYIPYCSQKVRELREILRSRNLSTLIQVDGGVNSDNAKTLRSAGASILVAGSSVFKSSDRRAAINALRCDD
jgi:ribulose-phosphate 3-epimerase